MQSCVSHIFQKTVSYSLRVRSWVSDYSNLKTNTAIHFFLRRSKRTVVSFYFQHPTLVTLYLNSDLWCGYAFLLLLCGPGECEGEIQLMMPPVSSQEATCFASKSLSCPQPAVLDHGAVSVSIVFFLSLKVPPVQSCVRRSSLRPGCSLC